MVGGSAIIIVEATVIPVDVPPKFAETPVSRSQYIQIGKTVKK